MKPAIFFLILVVKLTDAFLATPGNSNSMKTLGKLRAVLDEYKREEALERQARSFELSVPNEAINAAMKVLEYDEYRYVTYKIEGSQLIVDTILEKSNEDKDLSEEEQWNRFTAKLMGPDPKYAIYGIERKYMRPQSICVTWIPNTSGLRTKMTYLSSAEKVCRYANSDESIFGKQAGDLQWNMI